MSPTTYTADGRVIQHDSEAPPAEALSPAKGAAPPAPKAPRAPRAPTPTKRAPKAAPKTAAVERAETQRRRRVGKHKQ